YALFRHMSVEDNVSFGLRMRPRAVRPPAETRRKKVDELLALVQLSGMGKRYPHQLSGGQQQRVALARALAIEPSVLLLDEPFGALDAKVRKELRSWLRRLQQEVGTTCILVTHDQEEALEISDHVVLLNCGRIEQQGAPQDLFEHPKSSFALSFLGSASHAGDLLSSYFERLGFNPSAKEIYLRPHEIEIDIPYEGGDLPHAFIRGISTRGSICCIRLETGMKEHPRYLEAEISRETAERLSLKTGDKVSWKPKRIHVFS
ncbi:MAG: ATP-binding cassette domain-containing protein, partial [Oligoflexales bacterium]|nr:ATP-binding cassette domain-containing protein [Oligoflexales bacterium]